MDRNELVRRFLHRIEKSLQNQEECQYGHPFEGTTPTAEFFVLFPLINTLA